MVERYKREQRESSLVPVWVFHGVFPSSFLLALLSMRALIWQILTKKSISQVGEAAQCGGSSAYTMLILAGMDGSRKHTDLYSACRTSEERGGAEAG